MRVLIMTLMCLSLILVAAPSMALDAADVPRTSPKELKKKLDKGERVIVIDMRIGRSYTESPYRIKGDLRIRLNELAKRVGELPMGWEVVTYCT